MAPSSRYLEAVLPYLPKPPSLSLAWTETLAWWQEHLFFVGIAGATAALALPLAVGGILYFLAQYQPSESYRVTRALAGARLARFGVFVLVGALALAAGAFAATLLDHCVEQALRWATLRCDPGLLRTVVALASGLWTRLGPQLTALGALYAVGVLLLMPAYEAFRVAAMSLALVQAFRRGVANEGKTSAARAPVPHTPGRRPDVLIVSDLHIAAEGQKTIEGGLPDTRLFPLVESAVAALDPRVVIVAGDVTDTGADGAWRKASRLLTGLGRPVFVAPGNHDYHFAALNRVPPSRAEVLLGMFSVDDGTLGSSAPVEHVAQVLDRISPGGKRVGRGKKRLHFPVLHENAGAGLTVLVLDSNGWETTSPLSNAVGQVGAAQLAAARKLLRRRKREHTLLVVLHHHVLPVHDFMLLACVDAHAVLELALDHGAAAIVHGHKHAPYVREHRQGDRSLVIVSAGSALYDAQGPCAAAVRGASCIGLHLERGHVREVSYVTAASLGVEAREARPSDYAIGRADAPA